MSRFLIFCMVVVGVNCITRTKIEDNGLYKLQLQHDGRFLTVGADGQPSRGEWGARDEQKFIFQLTKRDNVDTWKLTSLAGALAPQWKISYVGHGKSQFKDLSTGKCLFASGYGVNVEGNCDMDDPRQRWYVDNTTKEAKS